MQRYSISIITRRTIRIKDHQTVVFCFLTFAITWGLGACVIVFPAPFRALFGELTGFHPLYILAVAAPTIAATMLTVAWEGWSGLRGLYASLTRWRFGFQWYVFALVVIPVLGWLTSRVAGADPKYDLSTPTLVAAALCLSIIATWLFQHTGGSVLITVLLHYTVNFSLSVLGAPFPAFTLVLLVLAIFVLVLDKDFGWFRKALSRPGPYELRSVT